MSALSVTMKKHSHSGFTALELIIVIGIMVAMIAMSGAAINLFLPDMRLKSDARDLYSTLQQARILALKNNRPAAVFFDSITGEYSLYDDSGDGNWATSGDNNLVKTTSLSHGVQFGHRCVEGLLHYHWADIRYFLP